MIMQDIDNLQMNFNLPPIFSYKYPQQGLRPIFIYPIKFLEYGSVYFPCKYKKCQVFIMNVGEEHDTI